MESKGSDEEPARKKTRVMKTPPAIKFSVKHILSSSTMQQATSTNRLTHKHVQDHLSRFPKSFFDVCMDSMKLSDFSEHEIQEQELASSLELGKGSFGCVLKVDDGKAIKYTSSRDGAVQIMQEIVVLTNLRMAKDAAKAKENEHVIDILCLKFVRSKHQGICSIAYEMKAFSCNLRSYKAKTVAEKEEMTNQLFAAVHFLRSHGVYHCDLKPENLLIEFHPVTQAFIQLSICDFGLSCTFDTPLPLEYPVVTSWYRAPEAFIKVADTHTLEALDLWSMGVIIYNIFMEPLGCLFSPSKKDDLPQNPSFEDFQYYDYGVLGKIFSLEKALFSSTFSSKVDEYALLHLKHGFIPNPSRHMRSVEVNPLDMKFSDEDKEDKLNKQLVLFLCEEVRKKKGKVTWIDLYFQLQEMEMSEIDDKTYIRFMDETEADRNTSKTNLISALYNQIIRSRCLCVALNNMRLENDVVDNFKRYMQMYPKQASMVTKLLDLDAKKRVEYFTNLVTSINC